MWIKYVNILDFFLVVYLYVSPEILLKIKLIYRCEILSMIPLVHQYFETTGLLQISSGDFVYLYLLSFDGKIEKS